MRTAATHQHNRKQYMPLAYLRRRQRSPGQNFNAASLLALRDSAAAARETCSAPYLYDAREHNFISSSS